MRKSNLHCLSAAALCLAAVMHSPAAVNADVANDLHLSEQEAIQIGKKVWKNECGGTVPGLTSWNKGEEFPSLGIGHFIWYPRGTKGPFDESFPKMLRYIKEHGAKVPNWLSPDDPCPWLSREEFLGDQQGEKMTQLRDLLAATVGLQTQFIVERLENALPKMLDKAPEAERAKIKKQFERVLRSGSKGVFALVDYVNFKGEGVVETERYNGEGWGMLQVLEGMAEDTPAVNAFADSAKAVLAKRVKNSPPQRGEQRWLPGWTRRVNDYTL